MMIDQLNAPLCPTCARPYDVRQRMSGDIVCCPHCGEWARVQHRAGGAQLTWAPDPLGPAPAAEAEHTVITLTQPWASLVAIGAKKIETRSWSTPYRGPLLIHAGMGLGPIHGLRGLLEICRRPVFAEALAAAGIADPAELPRGQLLAEASLINCMPIDGMRKGLVMPGVGEWHLPPADPELSFGDYSPGRWAWLLADVRPLERPIATPGTLRLWRWRGRLA